MNADQSHRFVLTGRDPEGHRRTIILWREVDLVDGKVVRRVVVTLDSTMNTATVLMMVVQLHEQPSGRPCEACAAQQVVRAV